MSTSTQQETTALTVVQRAAVALGSTKAAAELVALVEASKSITAVTNKDGRTECHAAAMRAMTARTNIEKIGKEARDDATKFSKAVIAEEARLIAIIKPEEDRLKGLRDAWDEKVAAEKADAERKERERIAAIQLRITGIKETPIKFAAADSFDVQGAILELSELEIGADFGEFLGDATDAKIDALDTLRSMFEAKARAEDAAECARKEREAEAERMRQERAELDRQREAQDAARKESERVAAESLRQQREEIERQQKVIAEQQEQIRREAARLEEIDREQKRAKAEEEAKATAKAKAEQEEAERQRKASEEAAVHATTLTDVLNAAAPAAITQVLSDPAAQPAAIAVTQAIPPAPVVAAAPDNGRYIRLGELNALLGFDASTEFLAKLGFAATKEKNARLYRECDVPAICQAIIEHVAGVPARMRRAA